MKAQSLFTTALFVLITTIFSACNIITGDGPIIEKTIPMDPFHSVNVDGSFDVSIAQSTQQSVVVATQENIFQYFKKDVVDGVLYLSLEPGTYMSYDLSVRLGMPTVSNIVLDGSGDIKIGAFTGLNDLSIRVDGSGDLESTGVLEVLDDAEFDLQGSGDIYLKLNAQQVKANLNGSGDIKLEGEASKLFADLNGSGDIDASKLQTIQCEANLDGSGTIRVHAKELLKADLQGSGDIRYAGEPKVEASIDGSGVIKAD